MKLKPLKLAPALIALGVIVCVCLLRWIQPDFLEQPELMTYDMRVREALHFKPPVAHDLGFVYIDDDSIAFLNNPNNHLGYDYGLYWPRSVYGRLVEELAAEKARAVALDVIFGELRPDHPPVQMQNNTLMESDNFFALQMRRAGNVILADTRGVSPPDLFATNALALGDIVTDTNRDSDGVLRRAQAFRIRRKWNPVFLQAQREFGVDLDHARIEPRRILLPLPNGATAKVPLDADGNFSLADFGGSHLPPGVPAKARPYTDERVWQMGIVLAAQELKLDLNHPDIDLQHGRIVLHGPHGVERVIPVDRDGYFYVDWCLTPNDPRLTRQPIEAVLTQDTLRLEGRTNGLTDPWAGKLIVVGSTATGNDLTDRGATPLSNDTFLTSLNWNVANSLITGRFVRRSSMVTDFLVIAALGLVATFLVWRFGPRLSLALVVFSIAAYTALATVIYIQDLYWLPLVLPVGGMVAIYLGIVTWRVVFEQAEQRRVRSIFSHIVAPDIVNELLQAEKLSLGGARREVTVLFADVRGFTEFTDTSQEKAEAYVAEHQLAGAEVEAYYDEQARETLSTVNQYLALVADRVKVLDGTLDKYIGDCVMAFWGAPTPNSTHALACVRAAIDAQRAIDKFNRRRSEENAQRARENQARASASLPPRPLLPVLLLGTGINTGVVTVGLMGSEAHISNYTVFGREVNLASRLESLSGRGRILISETTYRHLLRQSPELAHTCIALPEVNVKGIRSAVKIYEVAWKMTDAPPAREPAIPSEVQGPNA